MPSRTLLPHVINGLAWACILQWPWGGLLIPALVVLALVHVAHPMWSLWAGGERVVHRAFASGPLAMFAIDVTFLIAAWRRDSWGDLTHVFVPVLAVAALIALIYAATVMSVLRSRAD